MQPSNYPLDAMIVFSWNGRGPARPQAKRALRYLIRRNKPDVVWLMETKLCATTSESL